MALCKYLVLLENPLIMVHKIAKFHSMFVLAMLLNQAVMLKKPIYYVTGWLCQRHFELICHSLGRFSKTIRIYYIHDEVDIEETEKVNIVEG